jgi:hypothetical protein
MRILTSCKIRVKEEQIKEEKAKKPKDEQINAGIKPPENKQAEFTPGLGRPNDPARPGEQLNLDSEAETSKGLNIKQMEGQQESQARSSASPSGIVMDQSPLASGQGGDAFISLDGNSYIDGMHPSFMSNFRRMAEEYGSKTGKKIHVTSAFRSKAHQRCCTVRIQQKPLGPVDLCMRKD